MEPGYGYVKLWEASAAATGVDTAGLATVAAAVPKHLWTTPVGAARRPLRAVFELHIGPDLDVTPVSGIEALVTLARHTFAGGIAIGAGRRAAHLESASVDPDGYQTRLVACFRDSASRPSALV